MAALEIDFTVLSLPLEMGRTSNSAGDEFQNDTLGLLLNEKKKKEWYDYVREQFPSRICEQVSDSGLSRWTSSPCTAESAQKMNWLPMCMSSVSKLICSKYNIDNAFYRPTCFNT